ncbi:MAG: CHAT domain-containing protein [Acidobacteria bacterium]|nr:CHAT domain-containing protein [Acidobacteriota bacterium]
MTQDILFSVRALDDLTSVRLIRHVGPLLFKDPQIRGLLDASSAPDQLSGLLANLSLPVKREALTSDRSIWLARALLAALASHPRFAEILAKAMESLRRDELVAEASIPRGLATEIIRLLASASGVSIPESIQQEYQVRLPPQTTDIWDEPVPDPLPDPLLDLAQVALAPEGMRLPALSTGAPLVLPELKSSRTAWPHLKCDEAVAIDAPFDLEVGLRAERDQQLGGMGKMVLPAEGCTLEAQLIFDPSSFAIVEGQRQFKLEVTSDDPYPRRTVKMVALGGSAQPGQRDISVMYVLRGVVCGFASRCVLAAASLTETSPPQTPRPFAGIELAGFESKDEADLTIIIKRGDDPAGGCLSFAAVSPLFDVPVSEEPPTADVGSQPVKFLEQIIRTADTSDTPFSLFTALKGFGRKHIATKLPAVVVDALHKVASRVAPRAASVLIISDDPYVPWELAVIEPPLLTSEPKPSPFFAAQVALGRWVLPSGAMPPPHPIRSLAVREQAVVTGVYDRVLSWKRLEKAEEEAADLLKAWEGTSQKVEATFESVMECLGGDPAADVLHFALHGQFDTSGIREGLVLIEHQDGATGPAKSMFLRPEHVSACDFRQFTRSPFVFLNACQVGAEKQVLGDYGGMASAFLFAGASAVVAPIWSIDDADARGLALEFYEEAWKGEPPAELLRRQRARFTELAAKNHSAESGSPTHLAYQFFGHPKYVLKRQIMQSEAQP